MSQTKDIRDSVENELSYDPLISVRAGAGRDGIDGRNEPG